MENSNYTEKYINLLEGKVYVKISGEGQPIILLHGLGVDHSMWEMNLLALSKKFKVYALDLPGFGKSDKPDITYSIKYFAEAVLSIIKAEGLSKVHLIGASLGGRIVLELAIYYPEIVDKIIVVAPAGLSKLAKGLFGSPFGGELMAFALSKKVLIQKLLAEMVYDSSLITNSLVNDYIERAKDKRYLRAFKRVGFALGENHSEFIGELPGIKAKTLIIWGADDKILPNKDGYYLHKVITDSKLVNFSQCGHLSFMEKTLPFNKVIIDFLSGNNI